MLDIIEQVIDICESILYETDWYRLKPEDDLLSDLQNIYELEYKYSMLKSRPFRGTGMRRERILAKMEDQALDLCEEIAGFLLPVYEGWLYIHPLDPQEWVEHRYGEFIKDCLRFRDPAYLYDIFTEPRNILAKALLDGVEDLGGVEGLCDFVKLMMREDKASYGGPFPWNPEDSKDRQEYWEEQADSFGMELWDIVFNYSIDLAEALIQYLLEEVVFVEWLNRWNLESVVEDIKRGAETLRKLENKAIPVPRCFAELNVVINLTHTNGPMLDYVNEHFPDVDAKALANLSALNPGAMGWDDELREMGVEI